MTSAELRALADKLECEQVLASKPKPLATIDWSSVQQMVTKHIDNLAKPEDEREREKDLDHYTYEAAVETVFGRDVWKWINSRA